MKNIIILLLIFTCNNIFSQNISNIYNENGQLLIDTNYVITKGQLKKWSGNETAILLRISENTTYPQIYRESGIEGYAILSFDCDTSRSIKKLTITYESRDLFGQAVYEGILKVEKTLTNFLRNSTGIPETYFIPVVFKLYDFEDKIINYNAMPILKEKVPLISRDTYCPGSKRDQKKKDSN